jgi:hypothetical protein
VRAQPSQSGQPARVGWWQWGQTRVSETAFSASHAKPERRGREARPRLGDNRPMEADLEPRLLEARRERFFVRSQLKVLRRYRERQAAAGRPTAGSDGRLADLERELRELDETVEGLRARLGRPHRTVPDPGE